MRPIGGSEILYQNLIKYVGTDWADKINLISSTTDIRLIAENKINVIWQHLYIDQGGVHGMNFSEFTNKVDFFVYVSNWQLEEFKNQFNIDHLNNVVIKNAIEPISFIEKPKDRIQLIYTSMPDRGLEVLLRSWEIMKRSDVELTVYSSNIIYGKGYSDSRKGLYDHLFNKCKTTPGINYKGFAMNKAVRKALQNSHILAYPSIFPETSCLAAIEAGAAGCKIVTTNFGALPETCNGWEESVSYSSDKEELAREFAVKLNNVIDSYWNNYDQLKKQSEWFNDYYSWTNRTTEWKEFFKTLCEK